REHYKTVRRAHHANYATGVVRGQGNAHDLFWSRERQDPSGQTGNTGFRVEARLGEARTYSDHADTAVAKLICEPFSKGQHESLRRCIRRPIWNRLEGNNGSNVKYPAALAFDHGGYKLSC